MFGLLPKKYKKEVLLEYRLRLSVAALGLLFLTLCLSVVFFAVSAAILEGKEETVLNEKKTIESSLAAKNSEELLKTARETKVLIDVIMNNRKEELSAVIEDVVGYKQGLISVSGFTLLRGNSDDNSSLFIEGFATNRGALIDFADRLEQSDYIENVDVPISNFAEERDIDFSIKLSIKLQ
ncbi:MAG: hypothetical protein COV70_00195 [Parcubacteria group bacterium CG11_big_fil_rev_8_21_14_0_20_39_22]|nr:MAG: hypothetical protein COV70_00195 [Parcubacteria group bacterium CG11_big_fil_rev_8_21_14_0_20_39_22]